MRKIVAILLSIFFVMTMVTGCVSIPEEEEVLTQEVNAEEPSVDEQEEEPTPVILPLNFNREYPTMTAVGSVEPYGDYWYGRNNKVSEDLADFPALAYSLNISNKTKFSGMPKGYDRDALIEWGKYPGLNVDILHEYGFTGKGATIAYIDQPIGPHEQYEGANLHYKNNSSSDNSMHGPMVLSLLAGKDTGTAPEAEVYFYGHSGWELDQTTHAECLYQIIEQNEKLPEGEKITMVGFSDNIDDSESNAGAFRDAVKACEESGVMVFFCGDYGGGMFLPMTDKNMATNVVSAGFGGGVIVPTSGRTGAGGESGYDDYYYWGRGGLSWAMPYVLGLYAIVTEIDPSLTKAELLKMLSETATIANGLRIVNPIGFVASALRQVGRNDDADMLEQAVKERRQYFYAVMDTAVLSEGDISAIQKYLSNIDGVEVLLVDTASVPDAKTLYALLKEDAEARMGTVAGIQIFGTPDQVPAFNVEYRVQMKSGIDEGGVFLTDLFYGNFENDAEQISYGYNVLDHFNEGWGVDLVPQWPIARLPLNPGEFSGFFEKYDSFITQTALQRQRIVNFSNPIFRQHTHIDSFGRFLKRMDKEDIIDVPYTLYGNLDGRYPVDTRVEGNFTAENLAIENSAGIMELIINSHGQRDNIDQCIFEGEEEQRKSLINMATINTVLSENPYYLDCWTCLNGREMKNNLTTTALSGQCVGVFSATAIISDNGVDCDASVSRMAKSNFYYFYYNYFKVLQEGVSRSQAFFKAQQEYAKALLIDSQAGLRTGEGNYQFNLCNLLAYHNFGVIEPSAYMFTLAESRKSTISQSVNSVPKVITHSGDNGGSEGEANKSKPIGEEIQLSYRTNNRGLVTLRVTECTAQLMDNGRYRFVVSHTGVSLIPFTAFNTPDGELFIYSGSGGESTITFEMSEEEVRSCKEIGVDINKGAYFAYFETEQIK